MTVPLRALLVFLGTYALIAGVHPPRGWRLPWRGPLDRSVAAMLGAVAMVLVGAVAPEDAGRAAVNWDTIFLLLGMMVISAALARAGLFRWISHAALTRAHGPRVLLALLVGVSGALSALLVNDTVCVMLTPLVVALVDDAGLPALPFLLGLAFGSNAGSVATPTGNPQNMLIATLSGLGFAPFSRAMLLPALAALATLLFVLLFLFRRELRVPRIDVLLPAPALDRRAAGIAVAVLALVLLGFLCNASMAWTALAGAALVLLCSSEPQEILGRVDGRLLLFFASLFIVVHGVSSAGLTDRAYQQIAPLLGTTAVSQALRFGGFALLGSQLVSNVPFVLVAQQWLPQMLEPRFAWLSLALTCTLAGNLTPLASVANLIVLELAGEKGRISFSAFCASARWPPVYLFWPAARCSWPSGRSGSSSRGSWPSRCLRRGCKGLK